MKLSQTILIIIAFTLLVLAAGCTDRESVTPKTEMETMAEELTYSIDSGLEELREGISNNARVLSTTGLTGPEAEAVLASNLALHPWAISSFVISREGIVMTAVPENFTDFVGTDLSWQPQVQNANTRQVPIVSDVFMMVEGFAGILQSYPIFSETGEYLGYTDITYTPDAFLEQCILPLTNGTEYDVWVVQVDGTDIYDTTEEEIGKNVLTDPAYADPALQEIFTRILEEPSGVGEYVFWDQNWVRKVTKTAVWKTAGIDGAEWRVVVTRVEDGCGDSSPTTAVPSIGETNDASYTEMEIMAEEITDSTDSGLEELRAGICNNARVLSTTGLTGPEAEAALASNLALHPWAISSLVISNEGIVMTAVPDDFAGMVGTDLSWQPQVQNANTRQVPIVSDVFMMEEGFAGISQSCPIFSETGEYLGYTDITYTPDAFLEQRIMPLTNGTEYDVWVAQADGMDIYDTTEEEIGKNVLTDPAYADPALQEIFTRILEEPSGVGEYVFWDQNWVRKVTKTAVWKTAGIDGAEWRVVVTRVEDGYGDSGPTTAVPSTGETPDTGYTELKQFVNDAAGYAREQGKEEALSEFNDPAGTFSDGEKYIFAYGMDGTVLAAPYKHSIVGTVRTGISDSNGVEYINGKIGIAREGGGSIYYVYPNPGDDNREELKLAYIVPVDDEWFVGSGIYLPEIPADFSDSKRDDLVERVNQARDHAQAVGKDQAVADFNDSEGVYADGSRYIFAYDYNGTTLALPFQPEYIGTNRLDFADTYGVKILRWEISTAKRGGGFVYVQYPDPDTGDVGLKLCYVEPVNDEWFVGSGIYKEDT